MTISRSFSDGTEKTPTPPAWLLILLIKIYRIFLSPVMSYFSSCRFHPTCSQYGLDAIRKYGAFRGGWMTVKRILRCNPFFPGGFDPVE